MTTGDSLHVRAGYVRGWVRERALIARGRVTVAMSAREFEPPRHPIFILGCPRSGTSLLFELLGRHEALRSLGTEGHVLWNAYQHPRLKAWSSDRATAEDVRPGESRYVFSAIRVVSQGHRFLDKTPKNVLRIPYLAKLFPDASIVFVKRDGRDTVSSLIEGWRRRRGICYRLPQPLGLAEYSGRLWSYVLPPGWREWAGSSIAEVAALQYVASNETALEDERLLRPGSFIDVSFEALVANPLDETRLLLDRLELPMSQELLEMAADLRSHPVGAITPPRDGKWRERAEEIEGVLPTLERVMRRLGYRMENV